MLQGDARTLLAGERVALNLLQHLSGIATLTHACVSRVAGTRLVVRDTRKTVPGLRMLAKYAVRTGGGTNHRMGLDDAILIKDNHLAFAGGDLAGAVRRARAAYPRLPLEVECRTMDELRLAIEAKPDLILLDNMSVGAARRGRTPGRGTREARGVGRYRARRPAGRRGDGRRLRRHGRAHALGAGGGPEPQADAAPVAVPLRSAVARG